MRHVLEPMPFRGQMFVKNRTLLAAMTNKQSLDDGRLSEDEIHWLVRRAKGGFGITTTAAANVTKTGRGWEGEMGFGEIINGVTAATQRDRNDIFGLVFHGGMRAPENLNGQQPISASKIGVHMNGTYAREMSETEIVSMIDLSEAVALASGFSRCRMHGAHSYLICQLGSKTNRRTDSWGGHLGQKSFLREIVLHTK